jgi:transaldolase
MGYYAHTLIDFIFALLVYFSESDAHKAVMMKPFLGRISEYVKSTGNEKYEEDGLIKRITSNFNEISPNFNKEMVPDVSAMFRVEGDNIKGIL